MPASPGSLPRPEGRGPVRPAPRRGARLASAALVGGLALAILPTAASAATPKGARPTVKAVVHGAKVSWKRPAGVRRTVVEVRDLSASKPRWTRAATVSGKRRTVRRLDASHRYRVRLRFRVGSRTGRAGRSVLVRPKGRTPGAVGPVRASAQGTAGIALDWAPSRGAGGYRVDREDIATGTVERLAGTGSSTSRVDVPPARLKGHWLRYRVVALDGTKAAAASRAATARAPGATAYRQFLALGDSYAAGTGIGQPYEDQECARAPNFWGALVPRTLVPAPTRIACSGATTTDVRLSGEGGTPQYPDLGGTQLDLVKRALAAKPGPALITFSIGGNDARFIPQFTRCLVGDCLGDAATETALIKGEVRRRLDATFAQIARIAPAADVLAVGYPHLFDEGAVSGDPVFALTLTQAERKLANVWAQQVDDEIAASARAHGLHPVTDAVVSAYRGHGAGGPAPWINPVNVVDPKAPTPAELSLPATSSIHPNVAGNAAYASAVTAALVEYGRVARTR